MDEQKGKRGMIPRATHEDDQKSQQDNIPLDLTLEISMCVKALVFFYNTSEFYQLGPRNSHEVFC